MTTKAPAFRVDRGEMGTVLWFDLPDSSVNVLRPDVEGDLVAALELLENDPPKALVIASGKDSFCVGADVDMLADVEDARTLTEWSRSGQAIMSRIADLGFPTVAAISGSCLGGGLELALACDHRIAADTDATRLGVPEVQLGLIPGAGATVRLPELVGIETALDLILTGRLLRSGQARRKGLVDDVVHPSILIDAAFQLAGKSRRGSSVLERARSVGLAGNPIGRRLVFSKARDSVMESTHGNMPAPLRALEVVRTGLEKGPEAGFRAESEAFGQLAVTSQSRALLHLFRARRLTRDAITATPRPVDKVAVVGAGLMGAGIATVTAADAGIPVRIRDLDWDALGTGLAGIADDVERRRYLRGPEQKRILARVLPTTTSTGFSTADVVIEAVVEKLSVKTAVLAEMEALIDARAIYASNTSSIPIASLGAKAKHPGRVLGMHYFSPVPRMPLLEVVAGPQTESEAIAAAVDLGTRQGKTVIVVNDGPGFYTSRILAPYLDEAARMLASGASIDQIDRLMVTVGFPLGPFRLLDEVGLDIGVEIADVLHESIGERMEPNPILGAMVAAERLGKKNGSGFYGYVEDGDGWKRSDRADDTVYDLLGVDLVGDIPEDAADRMLLRMVNEALFALGDGILTTASDGDIGAVFGLGFPAHLGGPFHYVESQRGIEETVADLEDFTIRYGPRFSPAPMLAGAARSGTGFTTGAQS